MIIDKKNDDANNEQTKKEIILIYYLSLASPIFIDVCSEDKNNCKNRRFHICRTHM